jgi:hypothetical protein
MPDQLACEIQHDGHLPRVFLAHAMRGVVGQGGVVANAWRRASQQDETKALIFFHRCRVLQRPLQQFL